MRAAALVLAAVTLTGCGYSDPNPNAPSQNFTTVTTNGAGNGTVSVPPPPQPVQTPIVSAPPQLTPDPLPSLSLSVSVASLANPFDARAFDSCYLSSGQYENGCVPLASPVQVTATLSDSRAGYVTADANDVDFGDGTVLQGVWLPVTHTFAAAGRYRVTVTARKDTRSATSWAQLIVH